MYRVGTLFFKSAIAALVFGLATTACLPDVRTFVPSAAIGLQDGPMVSRVGIGDEGEPLETTLTFELPGLSNDRRPAFARLVVPSRDLRVAEEPLHIVIRSKNRSLDWAIPDSWTIPQKKRPVQVPSGDIRALLADAEELDERLVLTVTLEPSLDTTRPGDYVEILDGGDDPNQRPRLEICENVEDTFVGTELLGRPTKDSVTVNLISLIPLDVYVEYGTRARAYTWAVGKTRTMLPDVDPLLDRTPVEPIELKLAGLAADSEYHYRVRYRDAGGGPYLSGKDRTFRTARKPGARFCFAIVADEHLQNKLLHRHEEGLADYRQTLANVAAAYPDFMISLGDFAHPELYDGRDAVGQFEAHQRYLDQRSYIDRICHSIPFYLVLGNHEGEQGWRLDGTPDNLAMEATLARKKAVPNPSPDGFYSGNEKDDAFCGKRENYYAWTWGDALFVVLDPYWNTIRNPRRSNDRWDWTYGKEQYDWLQKTLHTSDAKWKFVFSHQLTGGTTTYGRGGIECAKHKVKGLPSFEWGGEDATGQYVFPEKRPGWTHGPIHDMFVREGVTALFHGHDHCFVHQELDGVVYQECPMPGDEQYRDRFYERGKYELGHHESSPGFVLVEVDAEAVNVEYVKTNTEGAKAKAVYSYTVTK